MKNKLTNFLRLSIVVGGLIVLALCIFALPSAWKGGSLEFPTASRAVQLIVIGLYATSIPFFIALWHAFKLLGHIDRGDAFSAQSVQALRRIKICASIIAILYVGGIPLLYPIAQADDAPGLVIFGAIIAGAPIVVAVFAAILQGLFQLATTMRSGSKEVR